MCTERYWYLYVARHSSTAFTLPTFKTGHRDLEQRYHKKWLLSYRQELQQIKKELIIALRS
jgi:hypothetical protein